MINLTQLHVRLYMTVSTRALSTCHMLGAWEHYISGRENEQTHNYEVKISRLQVNIRNFES